MFADDLKNMEMQAREISTWGKNINIKIPITNTKGNSTIDLIKKLSEENIICNVTAIFTFKQLYSLMKKVGNKKIILSVFAGRIADTGIDPEIIIKKCSSFLKQYNKEIGRAHV